MGGDRSNIDSLDDIWPMGNYNADKQREDLAREKYKADCLNARSALNRGARQAFEDIITVYGLPTALETVAAALEVRADRQPTQYKRFTCEHLAQRIRGAVRTFEP